MEKIVNNIPYAEDPIVLKGLSILIKNQYIQEKFDDWFSILTPERMEEQLIKILTKMFGQFATRCFNDKSEELNLFIQSVRQNFKECFRSSAEAEEEIRDGITDLSDNCYTVLAAIKDTTKICPRTDDYEACVQDQLEPISHELEELEEDFEELEKDISQYKQDFAICAFSYRKLKKILAYVTPITTCISSGLLKFISDI